MSKKRFNPLEDPPSASSSEEEEEISNGEGEEEEYRSSEEEHVAASTKKPEPEPEKEQVSDSGFDPDAKLVTMVKKKQDSKKVKTSKKSESKKRSSETDGGANVKKVKRVSGEEEKKKSEESKKLVWSEEDDILVLQGFIDYQTEKKVSPYDDTKAFYQYVKKYLSFDVSKTQFMEKVRDLKKRFETKFGKGKNKEEHKLAKANDRKAFELAKLIWGVNGIAPESAVKSNGKSKKVVSREELVASLLNGKSSEEAGDTSRGEEVVKLLARFGVDDFVARQGWSRLGSEDKKRFVEQLSALQVQEFELYAKRSGLIHEVVTKMAETLRSNS